MKGVSRFAALALAAAIAACGGGGGGSSAPVATPIVATLVQAGSVLPTAEATPDRTRVIRTQPELDIVLARLPDGSVPPEYRAPNFSLVNLLYLEGTGDDDPLSGLSIASAMRNADGSHAIRVEYCGMAAPAGTHRTFGLYAVPPLAGAVTFSQSLSQLPTCEGRSRVATTRIATGAPVAMSPHEHGVRVATNAAQWNEILAKIPPGDVPPQFANPDFSQVAMIYLEGPGTIDPTAYVRIADLLRASPSLLLLYAEFCGSFADFMTMYRAYALYSTPAFQGQVRGEWIYSETPGCRVPR